VPWPIQLAGQFWTCFGREPSQLGKSRGRFQFRGPRSRNICGCYGERISCRKGAKAAIGSISSTRSR
jgi:hypothetical protein